ncbi:hypothetical protein Lal_00016618 [Lupinus albus]|nr:hypothetical protein Lal_00016618 [Lupinus albus]
MEWCNQSTSIKYLFKYINKGYDRITVVIESAENGRSLNERNIDEVKQYLDCRYISLSEACWGIFGFPIHGRQPAIKRLYFHLPGEHHVYFNDNNEIDNILSRPTVSESMFTSWMEANKQYPEGRNLCYGQYVSKFVYKPRKSGYTIGRLIWVSPCTGELYYLRMILTVVKGATCYEDIRTVSNIQYSTFRNGCFAMGILQDDREYIKALKKTYDWGSGFYVRKLFVKMLLSTSMNKLDHVWEETWKWLCGAESKKFERLSPMSYPKGYITSQLGNRLIYDELNYDTTELKDNFNILFQSLTDEQCKIFKIVMQTVNQEQGCMFFLYSYGGTGKTHMWRTLTYALRSQKQIVLTVASSDIASLLLPGGRTTHSKFKILVLSIENSICNIHQGSELAGILKQTKLIIWDEAHMSHKFCIEALDKSLGDIMGTTTNDSIIFGGNVVIFCGDFRQILPVIPRGILNITKNMCFQNDDNAREIREFS